MATKPSNDSIYCKCLYIMKYMANNQLKGYISQTRQGISQLTPLQESSMPSDFVFDLFLCDSQYKFKLFLCPRLSFLVYDGQLKQNYWLKINSNSLRPRFRIKSDNVSEEEDGDEQFIFELFEKPQIFSQEDYEDDDEDFKELAELKRLLSTSNLDEMPWLQNYGKNVWKPISGSRGSYMPVFGDHEPPREDDRWFQPLENFENAIDTKFPSICDYLDQLESRFPQKNLGNEQFISVKCDSDDVIIGRVTEKTNMTFYGTINDKQMMYPYRFSFIIQDSSCSINVMVWNNLVMRYFNAVRVGECVAISGFRLKIPVKSSSGPHVVLNPSGPQGLIKKLTPDCFNLWKIDQYKLRFPRLQLNDSLDNSIYSSEEGNVFMATGRIQFVSPIYTSSYSGFRHRFIHIVYHLDNIRLIVKVYSHSQPKIFENLEIGLIFRSLVTINDISSDVDETGDFARFVYFTTIGESQLVLWDDRILAKKQMENESLKSIPKLEDISAYMDENAYFALPLIFSTFSLYPSRDLVKFHSVQFASGLCKKLAMGEIKRVLVNSRIIDHFTMPTKNQYYKSSTRSRGKFKSHTYINQRHALILQDLENEQTMEAFIEPNVAFFNIAGEFSYESWLKQSLQFMVPFLDENETIGDLRSFVEDFLIDGEFIVVLDIYRESHYYSRVNIVKIFETTAKENNAV